MEGKLALILAVLMLFTLTLSLSSCKGKKTGEVQPGESTEKVDNQEGAANQQEAASEQDDAKAVTDEYKPKSLKDDQDSDSSSCFQAEERVYIEPEEMPPLSGEITVEDRQKGYRLDYAMGYSFYLPRAWRELDSYISTDYQGNRDFSGEPIYESRYYYYIKPGSLAALDDLAFLDLPEEDKARMREEILRDRVPLFALILYRNDKLDESLISLNESKEFPERKILKAHGDLTLVLARAKFQEGVVGELFMNDYKSLYDAGASFYNSLNFFPPEDSKAVVQKRANLNFSAVDINAQSYQGKQLHSEDLNYILFWSDGTGLMRKYFEDFDQLAAQKGGKAFYSVLKTGSDFGEAEKSRLFKYLSEVKNTVPVILSNPEIDESIMRFIDRWPTLIVVDKSGQIIDLHTGVKSAEKLAELIH
ncbi:MAG: hypothetical protein Q4P08_04010 [Eubacteriales bacterium]|nr:hypothetical protein [Eubacteriales bacterium]